MKTSYPTSKFLAPVAALVLAFTARADAAALLKVDISQFLDNNPATNTLIIQAVNGAFPETNVTQNGNFPQLDLRNFFQVAVTGTQEKSASITNLADYTGFSFGQLFLSGTYSDPEEPSSPFDVASTSLGLLASNRQNLNFNINQQAFTGQASFDLTGMGITATSFSTAGSGDLYAQDFPWVRIGQWQVVPEPTTALLTCLSGALLLKRRR